MKKAAKKVVYYERPDRLLQLEQEAWEKAKRKKDGDRFSISIHYASVEAAAKKKIMSQSQFEGLIADLCYQGLPVIPLSPLSSGAGTKVVFQIIDLESWKTVYELKPFSSKEKEKKAKKSKFDLLVEAIESIASEFEAMDSIKGAEAASRLRAAIEGEAAAEEKLQ